MSGLAFYQHSRMNWWPTARGDEIDAVQIGDYPGFTVWPPSPRGPPRHGARVVRRGAVIARREDPWLRMDPLQGRTPEQAAADEWCAAVAALLLALCGLLLGVLGLIGVGR